MPTMDGDEDRGRSVPGAGPRAESPLADGGPARALTVRVPLWVLLVVLAVAAAVAAVVVATRPSVELGDAVDGARNVQVSVTICNQIVDARGINPREAELDFEAGLKDLGAQKVDVVVDRVDCGPETTPGTSGGR